MWGMISSLSLDAIVGHVLGGNFGEAKRRLRIDEARVDGHAGDIYDFGVFRDFTDEAAPSAHDLAALHDEYAVLDHAVGDG